MGKHRHAHELINLVTPTKASYNSTKILNKIKTEAVKAVKDAASDAFESAMDTDKTDGAIQSLSHGVQSMVVFHKGAKTTKRGRLLKALSAPVFRRAMVGRQKTWQNNRCDYLEIQSFPLADIRSLVTATINGSGSVDPANENTKVNIKYLNANYTITNLSSNPCAIIVYEWMPKDDIPSSTTPSALANQEITALGGASGVGLYYPRTDLRSYGYVKNYYRSLSYRKVYLKSNETMIYKSVYPVNRYPDLEMYANGTTDINLIRYFSPCITFQCCGAQCVTDGSTTGLNSGQIGVVTEIATKGVPMPFPTVRKRILDIALPAVMVDEQYFDEDLGAVQSVAIA